MLAWGVATMLVAIALSGQVIYQFNFKLEPLKSEELNKDYGVMPLKDFPKALKGLEHEHWATPSNLVPLQG